MSTPLRVPRDYSVQHRQALVSDQRIPPSRGLVVAHNVRGRPFKTIELQRWLRLSRHAFKADKVDVLANGDAVAVLEDLLPSAGALDLRVSLRTDGAGSPQRLQKLNDLGLFDVFLCPMHHDIDALQPWFSACAALDLPLRLQWQAPFTTESDPDAMARHLHEAGVVRVNLALSDPFLRREGCANLHESEFTIRFMQDLAASLEDRGVEANLLGLPFCLLNEESWSRAAGSRQCANDHAHYLPEAFRLAEKLHLRSPTVAAMIVRILLSNATLRRQPADNWLLPGLLHRNYAYLLARIFRRLTIHLNLAGSVPEEQSQTAYDKAIEETRRIETANLTGECRACSLSRICDHETPELRRVLRGTTVKAIPGDAVVSPLHFAALQPKYYDDLDRDRLDNEQHFADLAEEAIDTVTKHEPDLVIGPHDYGVEDSYFDRMESGIKWWSVSNIEKLSTPLGTFSLPLTISVDVGAGIADYIGFSLGRHCKLVCPMEGYRHNIILHIDRDGRYILLRDKQPVRPATFEAQYYLPLRLGERVQPRISAWNIDECIATQNVRVWSGERRQEDLAHVKYSIIIVSTRFTRRLHAVLRSLAHQTGVDLTRLEIIICYVPGIDATDDLIDSVTLTYPQLRFVRCPFPERYTNSKGFLINEAAKIAAGEWIMLLDSDTLLPPEYFAQIEAVSNTAEFIAPDGRKLLPKDITAKILMGELDPWDHWRELLEGPGEFRHRETMGIPVGFCQTFRAKYLQMFPYLEVDHFETADMQFGGQMKNHLGEETRLTGTPVIHLDHGGSQWYGTQKHM